MAQYDFRSHYLRPGPDIPLEPLNEDVHNPINGLGLNFDIDFTREERIRAAQEAAEEQDQEFDIVDLPGQPPARSAYDIYQEHLGTRPELPDPSKRPWWAKVLAGAAGGLAGYVNARGRLRHPIDASPLTERLAYGDYPERLRDWENRRDDLYRSAGQEAQNRQLGISEQRAEYDRLRMKREIERIKAAQKPPALPSWHPDNVSLRQERLIKEGRAVRGPDGKIEYSSPELEIYANTGTQPQATRPATPKTTELDKVQERIEKVKFLEKSLGMKIPQSAKDFYYKSSDGKWPEEIRSSGADTSMKEATQWNLIFRADNDYTDLVNKIDNNLALDSNDVRKSYVERLSSAGYTPAEREAAKEDMDEELRILEEDADRKREAAKKLKDNRIKGILQGNMRSMLPGASSGSQPPEGSPRTVTYRGKTLSVGDIIKTKDGPQRVSGFKKGPNGEWSIFTE